MAQLHYSDQEARRQVEDADHDAIKLQGEGYGVLSDDQKQSFNSSPHRTREAPLMEVHHNRNDPISSDQSSPLDVLSSGYGKLDAKPEDAGKASPASAGYIGGQLDEVAAKPRDEGYTSLGIEESVDENNSDHSLGLPSDNMKEREGDTAESMAKELEDHPAAGEEGIIDVHCLKENYVDLSEGNTNQPEVANYPALEPKHVDLSKHNTSDLKVNDPALEPNYADTAQWTSQIKCPDDDPKQEQTEAPCPHDDHDTHGCESFQGDDGREKIKEESFNVYSGDPESSVYDAADVLGDQHESERSIGAHDMGVCRSQDPVVDDDRSHVDQAKLEVQPEDFEQRRDEQTTLGDFEAACGDQPRKPRSGDHVQLMQDEIVPQEQATGVQEREDEKATVALDKGDDQIDVRGNVRNCDQPQINVCGDVRNCDQPQDDDVRNRDQPQIDVRRDVPNCDQLQDDDAFNPSEDVGGQEDSSQKVMPDVPKQACAIDVKECESGESKGKREIIEEVLPASEKSRDFSEAGTKDDSAKEFTAHISSPVEQDAGLKVDSQDREEDSERVNKEGFDHESDRENIERAQVNANAESPYTEFDGTNDYLKAGYGAEGFVPKHNEEVDRELREEPTEKVDQEEERRPTDDEHPLDKSFELDNMAEEEDSEDIGKRASSGAIEYGKDDTGVDDKQIDYPDEPPPQPDVYVRPPSLPHPQPQDLAATNINNYTDNSSSYEEQKPPEIHHEAPHKKGIFEKIKEKLTPPFSSE